VVVDLTTHDADGVTELDVELAREMETLSSGAGSS
jgi:pterin-4a-carbinolamine dehydratase